MSDLDKLELARLEMVRHQLRQRGITSPRVLSAMAHVPRERFVTSQTLDMAYDDRALAIQCGQTISQPYMVGLMTQALELSGSELVLEIGTGSGYQTAVLAELASRVVSIERYRDLSEHARRVLSELGYDNIELVVGDGSLGWPDRATYDRIIVTAAAEKSPPALLDQLRDGGILVIPVGDDEGQILQAIHKIDGQPRATNLCRCRFVPLIGPEGHPV